ncbi:hypothetical protein Tco_1166338 [Tanacetum coccineum]
MLPSNIIYLYLCPVVEFTYEDTMDDMNVPANDVPAEQAPTIAPLNRTNDQILPLRKWVPVGKINYVLDLLRSQRNPIYNVVVSILKNANFLRAFTASSMILAIYIQQFWDTMRYDSTIGLQLLVKLLDMVGQDILCFRSFVVSFIEPTSILMSGFGKEFCSNQYIIPSSMYLEGGLTMPYEEEERGSVVKWVISPLYQGNNTPKCYELQH